MAAPTKELAPGFRYDEHSTVHQVILYPGDGLTGAGRTTAMRMPQDLDIDFGQAI